ncbi:MAG: hypothetical protein HY221_01500 [Candidatus Sungbacteria bacterium]|uniref:Acyltransferase n=1 Tax=Candidatus Sungiibacteriota bacterium TaxID=2750080 RepID=A0A932VQY8_9BACT|nr:hypothetical protein [Candidatus Sungbacteria bacterium]
MREILGSRISAEQHLPRITISIVNRLRCHKAWQQPSLFFDEQKKRLHISPSPLPYGRLGLCPEGNLDRYILPQIRRVVFHDLVPMDTYLDDITGFRSRMIWRRVIMEAAKKVPSWRMKNLLYRRLGVDIPDWKTTIIVPNVFVDYIWPELIEGIGANTFVGEEAMLLTHFIYPDRAEIGHISIGANCLIGVRSLIAPGVSIGDNATVGAYAVVTRDVPSGATILGPKSG